MIQSLTILYENNIFQFDTTLIRNILRNTRSRQLEYFSCQINQSTSRHRGFKKVFFPKTVNGMVASVACSTVK